MSNEVKTEKWYCKGCHQFHRCLKGSVKRKCDECKYCVCINADVLTIETCEKCAAASQNRMLPINR